MSYSPQSLLFKPWVRAFDPDNLDISLGESFPHDSPLPQSPFLSGTGGAVDWEAKPIYTQIEIRIRILGTRSGSTDSFDYVDTFDYDQTTTFDRESIAKATESSLLPVEPDTDLDGLRTEGPIRISDKGYSYVANANKALFILAPSRTRLYRVTNTSLPSPPYYEDLESSLCDTDYQGMKIFGPESEGKLIALSNVEVGEAENTYNAGTGSEYTETDPITTDISVPFFTLLETPILNEWHVHDVLRTGSFGSDHSPIGENSTYNVPQPDGDIDISGWTTADWHDWSQTFSYSKTDDGVTSTVDITIS